MDIVLIVVTGLSLLLAIGMAALLARVLREERRRSEARVALLTDLAGEPAASSVTAQAVAPHAITIAPQPQRPAFEDLDLRPGTTGDDVSAPDLFRDHAEPSAWPRRLAVVAGLTVVAFIVGAGWRSMTPRETGTAAVQTSHPDAAVSPLELLALSHEQEPGWITIRGRVQNPTGGSPLSNVQATVLVFASDGEVLTSARAALDAPALQAGEESPFTIRVPVAEAVARYRVGFRGADDRPMGHVDRRSADSIARKEAP